MKEKELNLSLDGVKAKVVYHTYDGFKLNTLLVEFDDKRRVLSTITGLKKVKFVGNNYAPLKLSEYTMSHYDEFKRKLLASLGIEPKNIALLGTVVHMDELAICERSFEEFKVCCIATAGAKGNALRTGVEKVNWCERNGKFIGPVGTINILLFTNSALSTGAMARAIITATEAKTSVLQDYNIRSTLSPNLQATGTGFDNIIVASGKNGKPLRSAGGSTKIGELIGYTTKVAVTEAFKNHGQI